MAVQERPIRDNGGIAEQVHQASHGGRHPGTGRFTGSHRRPAAVTHTGTDTPVPR